MSNSIKSSPMHNFSSSSSMPANPYVTIHTTSNLDHTDKGLRKVNVTRKNRFWFMKPGALPASPYHTVQATSDATSTKKINRISSTSQIGRKRGISTRLPHNASDNSLEAYVALQRAHRYIRTL